MLKKVIISSVFSLSILTGFTANSYAWGFGISSATEAVKKGYDAYKDHQSVKGNPGTQDITLNNVHFKTAFSPDGDIERNIVEAINQAQQQVLVQAYGFTDKSILKALVEAKNRGVDVRIILDKSNETQKYSGATYMKNAGIPVFIDYKPAIAHNKVMIIDQNSVITGSFNFTTSAQTRNAENALVMTNVAPLAEFYIKDWNWRLTESRPYQGR